MLAAALVPVAHAQQSLPATPAPGALTDTPPQVAPVPLPAMIEPPYFEAAVAAGKLPPVAERIPSDPAVVALDGKGRAPGEYGGTLRILGGSPKDTRTLVVYGYARLVVYDADFDLVPDILSHFEIDEGRRFTFHLRPGHKWSNGEPFTSGGFPLLLGGRRQRSGGVALWSADPASRRRREAAGGVSRRRDRALHLVEAEPLLPCRRWPARSRSISSVPPTT